MSKEKPELSIVVPAYNEEENVEEVYRRVMSAVAPASNGVELLFVDDGSTDGTWEVIRRLAKRDARVKGVRFSRNFGHQAAVTAGVAEASGEAVVVMDCDLQDPPEVIPEMLKLWREGYEVVYGQRIKREGESWFKLATASLFYRLLARLTDVAIPLDTGDFRLMGPKAVEAFRGLKERNRFVRGLVAWIGFNQTPLKYQRKPRARGETHYPLRKMLKLALDGILSFSSAPIKLVGVMGILWMLVAGGMAVFGQWTGMVVALAASTQLLGIWIIGGYLVRILDESRERPLYIISERCGFASAEASTQL